jgi:hypothetical protein
MFHDLDIHDDETTPPEMPLAFDEAGRPIAVTHPTYEAGEDYDDDPRADMQTAIGNFLELLASSGDAYKSGQVLQVLAFLAGRTPYRTKAELAAALNVTPSRISQILKAIPEEFQSLIALKNRSSKDASL